jgi:predicted NBD/HSP70 family sugar kinase
MVDPDGVMCTCGRRGCLGDSVIPRRLVELAIKRGLFEAPGRPLDTGLVDECFTRMAKLADTGDTHASLILDEMARRVAAAIVTIVNLLDVDSVVFGGPFWERVSGFLLQRLPELINSSSALATTHPIVVTGSTIGDDVAAVGAACLVLESALSPRPSSLLISV